MSGRLALFLAVAAAGCQDREVVGAVPVKSVLVMAAVGAFITVTADEDPLLAGVSLRIPPGSLPRDLTVTIERGGADIVGTTTLAASPVVLVRPAGTVLSIPSRLGLPVKPGPPSDRLFIEVSEAGGHSRLTSTTAPDAGSAQASIDRFAAFQAARLRSEAAAPDAGVPPPPPPPLPPPPVPPPDAR